MFSTGVISYVDLSLDIIDTKFMAFGDTQTSDDRMGKKLTVTKHPHLSISNLYISAELIVLQYLEIQVPICQARILLPKSWQCATTIDCKMPCSPDILWVLLFGFAGMD